MSDRIAITQGPEILTLVRNSKSIGLPNGSTVPHRVVTFPHQAGEYTIRDVVVTGPLPAAGEIATGTAPPVIDGDLVVIRRTVAAMTAEQIAAELDVAKADAVASVRAAANAARDLFRTPGKDGVYLTKLAEGRAWRAAGEPADLTGYPSIAAEVGADTTAPTASALVALWEAMNDLWTKRAQPAIEGAEQRALKAIAAAGTLTAVDAAKAVDWPTPESLAR